MLFLYSYTQKSLDTIYAVTANYVDGIEVDEMDCFRDPSVTQRGFLQFLNLNFASTASSRCHTASTQSMGPCERLRVA